MYNETNYAILYMLIEPRKIMLMLMRDNEVNKNASKKTTQLDSLQNKRDQMSTALICNPA